MMFTTFCITADALANDHMSLKSCYQQYCMKRVVESIKVRSGICDVSGDLVHFSKWRGIECEDGMIRHINWNACIMSVGKLDLAWLPEGICSFHGNALSIRGIVPWAKLPDALRTFSAHSNALSGSIDLSALPRNLSRLDVSRNVFSGGIALQRMPAFTEYLSLSDNRLTGTVHLKQLADTLDTLDLSKNQLRGRLELEYLPQGIRVLNVAENAFDGEICLANVPGSMRMLRLNGNTLQGTLIIPKDLNSIDVFAWEQNEFLHVEIESGSRFAAIESHESLFNEDCTLDTNDAGDQNHTQCWFTCVQQAVYRVLMWIRDFLTYFER